MGCSRGKARVRGEDSQSEAPDLCILDPQGTATGVNVTSVQIHFRSFRRLDAVELNHGLNAVLFEDHDSIHLSVWIADLVNHLLSHNHPQSVTSGPTLELTHVMGYAGLMTVTSRTWFSRSSFLQGMRRQ